MNFAGLALTRQKETGLLLRTFHLVYFMAPAYVANMSAPLIKYWTGWNRPISRRWLGSHKTVMGFAIGVLGVLDDRLRASTSSAMRPARR